MRPGSRHPRLLSAATPRPAAAEPAVNHHAHIAYTSDDPALTCRHDPGRCRAAWKPPDPVKRRRPPEPDLGNAFGHASAAIADRRGHGRDPDDDDRAAGGPAATGRDPRAARR